MKSSDTNSLSVLSDMLRRAANEEVSYSLTDTRRDLVRAADLTPFTRLKTLYLNSKGTIVMTFSTVLAAIGLGVALWNMQPASDNSTTSVQKAEVLQSSSSTSGASSGTEVATVAASRRVTPQASASSSRSGVALSSQTNTPMSTVKIRTTRPEDSIWVETFQIMNTTAIGCDKENFKNKPDIFHLGLNSSGSAVGNVTVHKNKTPVTVELKKQGALEADDFLSAIGIEKKPNSILFNDGSKILQPGVHVDRYFSGSDYQMHIDVCKTLDSVIQDKDRPKVSFRPMYIVENTGRIVEFCDAAINKTGQVDASDQRILQYRDSCVTIVVHPNGKTPLYLLYYPSEEFLKALPREKALQVRAEQGNAAALRELQDSYRGCRYMSFCSTSNGAIEDTEILGSMSSDTKVKVSLREPRTMRVALYDIVGRLVAEIDRGTYYQAGQHIIPLATAATANTQHGATFYLLTITTDSGEKVSQRVVLGN